MTALTLLIGILTGSVCAIYGFILNWSWVSILFMYSVGNQMGIVLFVALGLAMSLFNAPE